MPYDPKCEELAAYFLTDDGTDTPLRRAELAQIIQRVIEDYLVAPPTDLITALQQAIAGCPCTMRERDSGHRTECFVPDAKAALSKYTGRV